MSAYWQSCDDGVSRMHLGSLLVLEAFPSRDRDHVARVFRPGLKLSWRVEGISTLESAQHVAALNAGLLLREALMELLPHVSPLGRQTILKPLGHV